jgi:retron-type reverse transcriptase
VDTAKPFKISKRQVWEASKRVKAHQGAAGVEGQSIAAFAEDWAHHLYQRWNRRASGRYFPPPVRQVDIPTGDGSGTRP